MLLKSVSPIVISVANPMAAIETGTVFTSSTGQQVAKWCHEKKHGLFTYYLLSGIQGAVERNTDGRIALGPLFTYVKENVERVSRKTTMEQLPSITPRIENLADVSLAVVPRSAK